MRTWFRSPGWTPKSLPIGWDNGVLSSGAVNFVLLLHFPKPEREVVLGAICGVGRGRCPRGGSQNSVLALPWVALDKALAPSLGTLLPVSGSNVESETLPHLPLTTLGLSSLRPDPSSHHSSLGDWAPWGSSIHFPTSSWKLEGYFCTNFPEFGGLW